MTLDEFFATHRSCVIVEIIATRGSAPREAGTFMAVAGDAVFGTIGGGNLELEAINQARALLDRQAHAASLEVVLGPDTGQCCGGRVTLGLRLADENIRRDLSQKLAGDEACRPQVVLFGAGHVGRALANALRPLPFRLSVVETRAEELQQLAPGIKSRLSAIPEEAVADIDPGGAVVILTHDHSLDFLIALQALKRIDLAYVGMIGSVTKRSVLANWLARQGEKADLMERLVLPIGGAKVKDKRPEVIAALVTAELAERLLGN